MGFFLSNLVLVSMTYAFLGTLYVLSILSLPYTLWSLWYQKRRLKKWCGLCLCVQAVLWLMFIVGAFGRFGGYYPVTLFGFIISLAVITMVVLAVHFVVSLKSEAMDGVRIRSEMNAIKYEGGVFQALLRKQRHCEVSDADSKILFGPANAKLALTVVCNPYCVPCARAHKEIRGLLLARPSVSVRYLFTSFDEKQIKTDIYLVSSYLENVTAGLQTLDRWYEMSDEEKSKTLENLRNIDEDGHIRAELEKHARWIKENGIHATPTILVNGYLLPEPYNASDLKFIPFE